MDLLPTVFSGLTLALVLVMWRDRGQRSSEPIDQPTPKAGSKGGVGVVMDTSAIIDGRIGELVNSGFMPDRLIIPRFVVAELQMLADGNDPHKRERARFGLDMVKQLQDSPNCEVIMDRSEFPDIQEVDDKLVHLAKQEGARLYTTDYNLNKVADIEGVTVLNVNELAQVLRPVVLPGETRQVKIIQKGSSPKQGVGYLEDGTMVVVDNAANKIGQNVSVTFSKTFQTQAGKMLFGELKNGSSDRQQSRSRSN